MIATAAFLVVVYLHDLHVAWMLWLAFLDL